MEKSEQPEKQLRTGLEIVHNAFQTLQQMHQQELSQQKTLLNQQRQQIVSLETEVEQLRKKLSEQQVQLNHAQQEKKIIQQQKNEILDKYQILKQSAIQLDTFRKQILNMVELNPVGLPIDPSGPDATFLFPEQQSHPLQKQPFLNQSKEILNLTPLGDLDNETLMSLNDSKDFFHSPTKQLFQQQTKKKSQQQPQEPQGEQNISLEMLQQDKPSKHSNFLEFSSSMNMEHKKTQESVQTSFGSSKKSYTETPSQLDAPSIYKQIKQILSAQQFDQFATLIAQFNANQLNTQQTIERIRELLLNEDANENGPVAKQLCDKMVLLIQRAAH